ncbi:MAG: hypothetical protein M3545_14105 [Acidobacteriota bacterium]|nr:hypothetical protein [Acidobacteriota bacterium]
MPAQHRGSHGHIALQPGRARRRQAERAQPGTRFPGNHDGSRTGGMRRVERFLNGIEDLPGLQRNAERAPTGRRSRRDAAKHVVGKRRRESHVV